jgi:excinuclease ABC subunit C
LEIRKTDTVLEAYILEQGLIKKLQPKYNAMGKDDKSFCYVVVTKEEFPRLVILRKTDLNKNVGADLVSAQKGQTQGLSLQRILYTKIYGPYTSRQQIETVLKILRKIFPYHAKPQKTEKGCLDYQIGLCPGPYDGAITKVKYAKNIRAIKMILEGKKKSLASRMRKEMEEYSSRHEYERAAEARNRIFALQHIQDVALISKRDDNFKFRISNFEIDSKFKIPCRGL